MNQHFRVVIIGGGAMGVSLLYHLCRAGWTDIALLEKNELTAGSTWHAAGLCTHFAHNLTIMHMRAHSVRLYAGELEADTGQPVGFHQTGALRVTRSPDRMDEFRQVQGIGRFAGFDFHLLSPQELGKVHPLAKTTDMIGAIHEPLDGHVDPSQATHAMAHGARQRGAKVFRGTRVTGISRQQPAGDWLISTSKGDFAAEHIVNAAGTWGWEVGKMMGLDLPIVPMLHQYVVTEGVDEVGSLDGELPIIRDPEESWYVRQERDGLIVGPYERDGVVWSPDGVPPDFGMELLPPDLDRIAPIYEKAMGRVPVLEKAGIKTIVNGPITFTPDAGPLIGPACKLSNAWLLTGSSMGVMEGGGAGKFLADWMISGEPPMDPLAVDSRRFGNYATREYRIAKAIESFGNQFAIHFPYEERPAGRPTRISPVHVRLQRKGAVFGAAYGLERPNWFATATSETQADLSFGRANWFEAVAGECRIVRDAAGLADLTAFSKFEVRGSGAEAFIETLGANQPPSRNGRIGLTHALSTSGGVLSEFTVTRLADNLFYLTSAAGARRMDADLLRAHAVDQRDVEVRDVSEQYGILGLAGPNARTILEDLTDHDLSNAGLPWLGAAGTRVAGMNVRLLRLSYAGEAGFELHVAIDDQAGLFDALMTAGKPHDLGLFGAYALNAMRLEKGYRAWGLDLTSERDPLEAGLNHLIKSGGRMFRGRDAVLNSKQKPGRKQMVLLDIQGEGPDPFFSHPVMQEDRCCGIVTSGTYGHRTGKKLGLAYLDDGIGRDGLEVEILGHSMQAVVLDEPPYDPSNKRMRQG